jgi:hypothetical protein
MTEPQDFLSEIVQTRFVQLLRTEERPPTLREIAEKLNLEPVAATVNLGALRNTEEVIGYVGKDGKTRFEFAPHDDDD